jgi:hypothetical protein
MNKTQIQSILVLSSLFSAVFTLSADIDKNLIQFTSLKSEFYNKYAVNMILKKQTDYNALPNFSIHTLSSCMYYGGSTGHWITKNIDNGAIIILEDRSIWKVDPFDKTNSMLWLPISNITVISSSDNFRYDYLLINEDTNEKVHAKYLGKK